MKTRLLFAVCAGFVVVLLICAAGFAQDQKKEPKREAWANLPDFSATEARGSLNWKVYHSGSMLRVQPSSTAATIWAPDEDKVYHLIILERTTCVVMKTEQAKMVRSPLQLIYASETSLTPTSKKDVVDGHTCTVLEGTSTVSDTKIKSKVWAADDLNGVPLRIDLYSENRVQSTLYRDVVLGTPASALFTLPSKCIPPEKTYQLAPGSSPPPSATGQKPVDNKP
jgi:hypothetical protein